MSQARPAVIAVASGKGGTGKTTVAAHLAVASSRSRPTLLLDLDVEAPDVLGYFPGAEPVEAPSAVAVAVPRLVEAACTGCGLCAKSCRFGAIVAIGGIVTIDERICKGCGRCVAICPAKALAEADIAVGATASFRAGGLSVMEGRMAVGDIRSTAVIEASKRRSEAIGAAVQIRDCPPGVSCPATHAIEGAGYVVLVAEPTEFSLHDLGVAVDLARGSGLAAGVVVNKDGFGTADIDGFCGERGIPIIGRVGFDARRAASGAAGMLWEDDRPFMEEMERVLAVALDGARRAAGGRP